MHIEWSRLIILESVVMITITEYQPMNSVFSNQSSIDRIFVITHVTKLSGFSYLELKVWNQKLTTNKWINFTSLKKMLIISSFFCVASFLSFSSLFELLQFFSARVYINRFWVYVLSLSLSLPFSLSLYLYLSLYPTTRACTHTTRCI